MHTTDTKLTQQVHLKYGILSLNASRGQYNGVLEVFDLLFNFARTQLYYTLQLIEIQISTNY